MPVTVLNKLLKQAESLTRKEQLHLAICLINKAYQPETSTLKWKDICGLIPYHALGEDAQDWVSRNRTESDSREKQWVNR